MKDKSIKQAFFDSLPVFPAYFPLGVVWGILWEQAGFSPLLGIFYSAFVYAGAVQFLALTLLIADASLLSILATTIPVGLRNGFYTLALMDKLPKHWLEKIYTSFSLADATFAILASKSKKEVQNHWYTIPLGIMIQLQWVMGTGVGVFFGSYVPDGVASLDFALPSLIAVLAYEQLLKCGSWKPLFLSTGAAVSCWAFFGHNWFLPSLVLCMLAVFFGWNEE